MVKEKGSALKQLRTVGEHGMSLRRIRAVATQFPDDWEFRAILALATKTGAVRHWPLREEREYRAQKTWTYVSSPHLSLW